MLGLSKNLRKSSTYRGVFINPDLTLKQRKKDKELREELKVRREAREDVIIYRNQIVERNSAKKNLQ